MPLYQIGKRTPQIDPSAFVHPEAVIIGEVVIGPRASVWPTAVLRGDSGRILVGGATSVQDGSIIHCTSELDTVIGERCVIGHRVHLEGCTIEDDSLVGSGSVVLHRAVVRRGGFVAAGAVVSPNTEVPAGALAIGVPARIKLGAGVPEMIAASVQTYLANTSWYREEMRRID